MSRRTGGIRGRSRHSLVLVFALLAVGAAAVPAAAQETTTAEDTAAAPNASSASFAVQPSGPDGPGGREWFLYTLDPGQVFGDTVGISNLSDEPLNVLLYAKDASNVPRTGGFLVQKDEEQPADVGSWITLATTKYTVPPNSRIDVPFSVTIPDDAEPGDHAGAIIATDADKADVTTANDDGTAFNVRERIGARVYVRVGGPVAPALRVDSLVVNHDQAEWPIVSGGGSADVDWSVRNTGNVRLTPTAQLRVKGFLGRTIKTLPVHELPELLPGGTFEGQDVVEGLPTFERLSFELNVKADDVDVTRTTTVWALHWAVFALIAALAAGAALWWFLRRRRRGGARTPSTATRPREREPVAV